MDIRDTKYCRYKKGEIVAVAQSYENCWFENKNTLKPHFLRGLTGWNNKLFVSADRMPHKIRITDVRVERLQDISYEDCLKEGIITGKCGSKDTHYMTAFYCPNEKQPYCIPQDAYCVLIDNISGKGTWKSNPYVFVYDFELIK